MLRPGKLDCTVNLIYMQLTFDRGGSLHKNNKLLTYFLHTYNKKIIYFLHIYNISLTYF